MANQMPPNGESPVTTKTKTRTHVVVGVLFIVLGAAVVFAAIASYSPTMRNRLGLNLRSGRLTRVVVPTPTPTPTPAPSVPESETPPAAPPHTPAVGFSEGICDNLDNDNDGAIDDGCDADNDNYCASVMPGTSSSTCTSGGGDCVDGNAEISPGAQEDPGNLYDDNCDNIVG